MVGPGLAGEEHERHVGIEALLDPARARDPRSVAVQEPDEPFKGDYYHGTLAMANAGPNTNGSQFFIVLDDLVGRLPKSYTIFGQVTKGMDVVDAIAAGRTGANDRSVEPVKMTKVSVAEEKGREGRGGLKRGGRRGSSGCIRACFDAYI